jgi:hypothetical protein
MESALLLSAVEQEATVRAGEAVGWLSEVEASESKLRRGY